MNRKVLLILSLAFVLPGSLFPVSSFGLVNPKPSQTNHADWFAFIFAVDETYDSNYVVCSGVLIDPNWVLSSRGCLLDPYETLEILSTQNEIRYRVEIWGELGLFEVVDSIPSPDGRLVMHKLNRPSAVSPIRRSLLTPEALLNTQVEVPGFFTSEDLGNVDYNPDGNVKVTCRVQGELYIYDNSYCYVLSPERFSYFPNGVFGSIIDPTQSGPLTVPLDKGFEPELEDDEIYINFETGSFPCHEDLGSPVVASINGETRLVGVVTYVGIAAGLSICADTLYNTFSSTSYYDDFIRQTLLRDAFDSDCPSTTRLRLEEQSDHFIRLHWEPQSSATGYKILYSLRLGYEAIQEADLGDVTEVRTQVSPDTEYHVSLLAYNDRCTSQPSDPVTILLNKP